LKQSSTQILTPDQQLDSLTYLTRLVLTAKALSGVKPKKVQQQHVEEQVKPVPSSQTSTVTIASQEAAKTTAQPTIRTRGQMKKELSGSKEPPAKKETKQVELKEA